MMVGGVKPCCCHARHPSKFKKISKFPRLSFGTLLTLNMPSIERMLKETIKVP
jgi:hypothetical protein